MTAIARQTASIGQSGDVSCFEASEWLPPAGARLAAFAWIKRRFPYIGDFLATEQIVALEASVGRPDGVVGWGRRFQARLAQHYATRRGVPFWTLEDGFLRSVGLGKAGHRPISILADDLGVHYCPKQPSRLEIHARDRESDFGPRARARSAAAHRPGRPDEV